MHLFNLPYEFHLKHQQRRNLKFLVQHLRKPPHVCHHTTHETSTEVPSIARSLSPWQIPSFTFLQPSTRVRSEALINTPTQTPSDSLTDALIYAPNNNKQKQKRSDVK